MKVLIVSQYFWPEDFRINDLALSLTEKGLEIDVLTGKPNYPQGTVYPGYKTWGCKREQWNKVTIFRVPLVARGNRSALRMALNYLSYIVFGTLLGPWLLRKRGYDVIFVYGMSPILQAIPGLVLGWLKRCPVIVFVQDLWPESLVATGYVRNQRILKQVARVVHFIYRHSDLLLVQSKAFIAPVVSSAAGCPVLYYPNTVTSQFLDPPPMELPSVPALEQGFSVVFAGNVGTGQAVETIVQAAELLKGHPDIRFVVFGNGSRWEWMRDECKARGLTNLHLPGRFPIDTMPGLLRKASALLVTLTDQLIFEATIPSKLQAYMAVGQPILACLNGEGARLVLEAGAGLVAPAEDAVALAGATLELYKMSPAERAVLGANARSYFKAHFDHEVLIEELIDYLKKVLLKKGRAR
jgi:glycosyltransferase involved in cell wall biosynthesis